MQKPLFVWFFTAFMALSILLPSRSSHESFPGLFFKQNRARFLADMPDSTIAVFFSADQRHKHVDLYYPYRQESSFYYLAGVEEPGAKLICLKPSITVNSKSVSEILFLNPPGEKQAKWSGKGLQPEEAQARFDFEMVLHDSLFRETVFRVAKRSQTTHASVMLYQPKLALKYPDMISSAQREFEISCLKNQIPVKNSSAIVAKLRATKQPEERRAIKIAVQASVQGLIAAIKRCKPGLYEYELASEAQYVYAKSGGLKPAYPPIVGSGPNALILHYAKNTRKIQPNDLVLMDMGAEYKHYASDITRTVPASGTFTKAQRLIYNLVLNAQEQAIKACRVGATLLDVHEAAKSELSKGLVKAGILTSEKDIRKYMWHFSSHHVGLDVHDPYHSLLDQNMILAVEPGLYIPKNSPCDFSFWGIGIRIEDMVLITANQPEVLSRGLPKKVNELEKLIRNAHSKTKP